MINKTGGLQQIRNLIVKNKENDSCENINGLKVDSNDYRCIHYSSFVFESDLLYRGQL